MSLFTKWNDLLLSEYFSPASSNDEVWIQTSRHELDSFGLHLGGADGLVDAVKAGAPWFIGTPANCAEAALQLAQQRRAVLRPRTYVDPGVAMAAYVGAKAPPYLPILALWVLAISEATDDGFYAQVRDLLGQSFSCTPQITNAVSDVWEDLERWSSRECAGRFGKFQRRVLGKHRFVGIPRSQCLVSRKDARGIRQLFVACGLHPGQELTPGLLARIAELSRNAHYLSNGLKYALAREAYREPLMHLLGPALQSWDGRRPEPTQVPGYAPSDSPSPSDEVDLTTLALAPSAGDSEGWDIRWRFRASGQGNACFMVVDGARLPARLEPWGDCFGTQATGSGQDALRAVLANSGTAEVMHGIEYSDEDAPELGGGTRTGRIARRLFRVLAWDAPDPRFGEELVERGLPLTGPLYLVCSSSDRGRLEKYLKNESVQCEYMPATGLPAGWTLTCIPRAERLTAEQRHWLSEEDEVGSTAARLRFTGGRPILRGGSRLFAWYDLPNVEVEAPIGAEVLAQGLQLDELRLEVATRSPLTVRRFRIQPRDQARLTFEVQVVAHGRALASARLRISPPEGMGVGQAWSFSNDPFGRARQDDLGLRGARIGSDGAPRDNTSLTVDFLQIERPKRQHGGGAQPHETVSGKFLDSLAMLGSIGYGAAREQLMRLAETGGTSIQPALLLLELRSRAHLEIQTDDKGHLTRVHRVPPTLYRVPATYDGMPLFGVCGSLRAQHWVELLQHNECIALLETRRDGRLPALRMATYDDAIEEVARSLGFQLDPLPCEAIARWAGSLVKAKEALSSWGWSSLKTDLYQLQRLHPNTAQFGAVRSGTMVVEPNIGCQLFRFDDPSVPGLQVHVLGTIQTNGSTGFSFIHDSRWGVWIAQEAFARLLRAAHSREDVYPWPIPYDSTTRDFWLPARMRPPAVVERALTLCSGSGPKEVMVEGVQDAGRIRLNVQGSGEVIGLVGQVYQAFTPSTWLCYLWVPHEIASRVASLLGAQLSALYAERD